MAISDRQPWMHKHIKQTLEETIFLSFSFFFSICKLRQNIKSLFPSAFQWFHVCVTSASRAPFPVPTFYMLKFIFGTLSMGKVNPAVRKPSCTHSHTHTHTDKCVTRTWTVHQPLVAMISLYKSEQKNTCRISINSLIWYLFCGMTTRFCEMAKMMTLIWWGKTCFLNAFLSCWLHISTWLTENNLNNKKANQRKSSSRILQKFSWRGVKNCLYNLFFGTPPV